jgi:hypothetical protein
VEDDLHAIDRLRAHIRVAEISVKEIDPVGYRSKVREISRRQVVDHADGVAELDESMNEMRANEACTTGNKTRESF